MPEVLTYMPLMDNLMVFGIPSEVCFTFGYITKVACNYNQLLLSGTHCQTNKLFN